MKHAIELIRKAADWVQRRSGNPNHPNVKKALQLRALADRMEAQNPLADSRAELCVKACEGVTDDGLRAWLTPPDSAMGLPHGSWAQQLRELWDEKEQFKRMFHEACWSLALINEHLELNPDDAGHIPIIAAIDELKSATPNNGESSS